MGTPFVRTDAEGRILNDFGKITDLYHYLAAQAEHGGDGVSAPPSYIENDPNGGSIPGDLTNEDGGDIIAVELVQGQTYTFNLRGAATNGIVDPYLQLLGTDQTTLISEDDDGGLGRSSQITYTAATTGTYYLRATSWYQIDPTAPDYQDNGDYTIAVWSPEADIGATRAAAVEIAANTTTYGYLDAPNDQDMFKIELTEGTVYTFTYNGGISGAADWDGEPGENIGILRLYDGNGVAISATVNYETGVTYIAAQSGTYYLRADSYQGTFGGYTIDVVGRNLADFDPLESLNWDSAANVPFVDTNSDGRGDKAYVYFAPAGENFGEREPDGVTPMTTYGWTEWQIEGVMNALEQYEYILGVDYEITTDVNQATFRMLTTENQSYGARFYPQDPAYGGQAGIGTFNLISGGFGTRPESLVQGGFSYAVVLHEFGHAHGIAHPHDTGGGSEIMLGVAGSSGPGTYGIFNLNQGVYTVMSYNDAWDFHPDGPTTEAANGSVGAVIDHGWSGTLSAFDIAILQRRYGVTERATGNDVYVLNDDYKTAYYQTIWDSGGTDSIAYNGALDAQIDLTAATLDYSATGGGVVSFLYNDAQPDYTTEIKGGYTIANGVVIENATGGSGDDALLGNNVANVLKGNGGDDVLIGRGGGDILDGGAGFDTASYSDSKTGVTASLASNSGTAGDAAGDKYVGIEKLEGSNFADTLGGGNGNDSLSGLGGDDLLVGGNGNDTLDGGAGDDTLEGGNGADVLAGGDGADLLRGGNDADALDGGAGVDRLEGGNGGDTLNGGAGNDTLVGGNGNDIFVIADQGGYDIITDFRRGADKVDVSDLGDFTWVGSGAFSGGNDGAELQGYTMSGKFYLSGDVDGDGVSDFLVQVNTTLTTADIILAA